MSKRGAINTQNNLTYEQLEKLYEVIQRLLLSLSEKDVLKQIGEIVVELVNAEICFIEFYSDYKGCMQILWPISRWGYIEGHGAEVIYTLLREVIDKRCSLRIPDSNDEERFDNQEWFDQVSHGEEVDVSRIAEAIEVDLSNAKTMLIVPFVANNNLVGSLYVDRKLDKGAFSLAEQHLLDAFATQAAASIDTAKQYEQEKRSIISYTQTLSPEFRTPLTVIEGYTQIMLMESENLSDKQKERLEAISVQTKTMLEALDQMIQITRDMWS